MHGEPDGSTLPEAPARVDTGSHAVQVKARLTPVHCCAGHQGRGLELRSDAHAPGGSPAATAATGATLNPAPRASQSDGCGGPLIESAACSSPAVDWLRTL